MANQISPAAASVHLPETETFDLYSRSVGDTFRIFVAPAGVETGCRADLPLLVLLDADLQFAMAVQIYRLLRFGGEVPELLIVGVGYPESDQTLALRARDLTPTPDDASVRVWLEQISARKREPLCFRGTGGAGRFLEFLIDELLPLFGRVSPDDFGRTALAGYSYGGLFALHALFSGASPFSAYMAGSPSLYWDDRSIFGAADEFLRRSPGRRTMLYCTVGSEETGEPEPARMVENFRKLTRILENSPPPALRLEARILAGETHMSGIPLWFTAGLKYLFGPQTSRQTEKLYD